MSITQEIHRIMKELKQDKKQYAQRKIILSLHQHLLTIGQFQAAVTPISFSENHVELSLILPKQAITLCSDAAMEQK